MASLRKTQKRLNLSKSLQFCDPLRGIRMKHRSLTCAPAQNEIKMKICHAMNQLNDIDSRSVGLSILRALIEKIPHKLLSLVIEPFSTINKDSSTMCRKEVCLLIGHLALHRATTPLFFKKYLLKLIRNLSKRAADSDARVRTACAQSVAQLTKQCVGCQQNDDTLKRQFLDKMLKSLSKSVEKGISPHSISGNLQCLSSLVLSAAHALHSTQIEAICECITGATPSKRHPQCHIAILVCIEKLLRVGHEAFAHSVHFTPSLAILIDALTSNDWNVRLQAVSAVRCLGESRLHQNNLSLPKIEAVRDEIMAHLDRLKFDKISNVRKAAADTLAIWNERDLDELEEDQQNMDELEQLPEPAPELPHLSRAPAVV